MAITITHAKTNAIADWTQPQLDAIIAGGAAPLPPVGTTLAEVTLPSDWNDDHVITGLDTEYAKLDGTNQPFTGGITAPTVTASNINNTSVLYAGTAGLLSSSGNFVYNATNGTLTSKSASALATVTGANTILNGNPFVSGLTSWTIGGSGTGWSNSGVGALHASGNTNPLSQTFAVTSGAVYRVQYTVGASGVGSSFTLTVVVDGVTISTSGSAGTRTGYIVASSSSITATITPTSTHTRLVSAFKVEQMTASTPCFNTDTSGSPAEIRASSSTGAVALGNNAGGFLLVNGTAFGQRALASCVNSSFNTAFGFEALEVCNAQFNTGIGYQAGKRITSGTQNFCAGGAAGTNITSGSNNMALGHQALNAATTGSSNVGVGANTGGSLTTGNSNTLVGQVAGSLISTGGNNTHIGQNSGGGNSTANYTMTLGSGASLVSDTDYQLSIGNAIVGNMSTRLLGIGIDGNFVPAATWHIEGIAEQQRLGYDVSNYFSTTVGATGAVTFDAVGTAPAFVFSDDVSIAGTVTANNYTRVQLFTYFT